MYLFSVFGLPLRGNLYHELKYLFNQMSLSCLYVYRKYLRYVHLYLYMSPNNVELTFPGNGLLIHISAWWTIWPASQLLSLAATARKQPQATGELTSMRGFGFLFTKTGGGWRFPKSCYTLAMLCVCLTICPPSRSSFVLTALSSSDMGTVSFYLASLLLIGTEISMNVLWFFLKDQTHMIQQVSWS